MTAKQQNARTILQMMNVVPTAPKLSESAIVVVDAQREYVDGSLPLFNVGEALEELRRLLARARKLGVPIFHVVHHAPEGAPVFNPKSDFVQIAEPARPVGDEPIIVKNLPSSFVNTNLKDLLEQTQRKNVVISGFMTHMCIDATARSATDLGFSPTIVASACTTRDLPSRDGSIIPARTLHNSVLSALSDLVSGVVESETDLPD